MQVEEYITVKQRNNLPESVAPTATLQVLAKNQVWCSRRLPVVGCKVAGNHICLRIAVRNELAQLLAKAAAHILAHILRSAHFIDVNMHHLPAL